MKVYGLVCFILLLLPVIAFTQDPTRFEQEVRRFSNLEIDATEDVTVFTGSSSIRFWKDLKSDCSNSNVLNTGFGGSHMSDLLFYLDEAVLQFNPSVVYIYEGDNDISAGKELNEIMATTRNVVEAILKSNSDISIHFISAKPSPSRWEFKQKYERFNTMLEAYCMDHSNLSYIDVWNPMLNNFGCPNGEIFIADSLHMNRKGYLLWKEILFK